ncbi:hypothetical protein [Costertonia aggregata]|uniref:Uncharacterized protein n=1 Tax=Costertonia aggregata TaxID=343403 RepID=A0A7H9ANE7_9FLAO|nr:hypothetical protein [Costertonia aggregata]QLG44903.1 hypothetical protein HYG79_05895 [Costertonia aggregata]
MVDIDWEQKQIQIIRGTVETLLLSKKYHLDEIVTNNRDGGYVKYVNKTETIEILFLFLPDYDVLINCYEPRMKSLIKFLLTKRINKKNISIASIMKFDSKKMSLEMLLQEAILYIKNHNL